MTKVSFEPEKIKKTIESGIEKALGEGKKWFERVQANDLLEKAESFRALIKKRLGSEAPKFYDALGVVAKEEFEELAARVAKLEKKAVKSAKTSAKE